jgi:hypothetical protein
MKRVFRFVTLAAVGAALMWAQGGRPFSQVGEVAVLVVPLEGRGTGDDPVRPALRVPAGVAWRWIPSDDGRLAIVEVAAPSMRMLAPLRGDSRPGVQVFERGRDSRADVEREIRKIRKDFSLERFLGPGREVRP